MILLAMCALVWWAVRATMPYMTFAMRRAIALRVWVVQAGLCAAPWGRWLLKAACFTIIMVTWNGRRLLGDVVAPIWERIRHYADLQAAVSYVLVPVVAILVAWFIPTGLPTIE